MTENKIKTQYNCQILNETEPSSLPPKGMAQNTNNRIRKFKWLFVLGWITLAVALILWIVMIDHLWAFGCYEMSWYDDIYYFKDSFVYWVIGTVLFCASMAILFSFYNKKEGLKENQLLFHSLNYMQAHWFKVALKVAFFILLCACFPLLLTSIFIN